MTIAKPETERMLADLQQELAQKLASWTWPSGVDSDEIIAESIEASWAAKEVHNKKIGTPIRWLLSTARRLKLEKSRSVRACRREPLSDYGEDPQIEGHAKTPEISGLSALAALETALAAFGSAKQFAITEILMFDRGVTEVAKELGIKRSTVNGWICRLPKRLAQSPALQALITRGES